MTLDEIKQHVIEDLDSIKDSRSETYAAAVTTVFDALTRLNYKLVPDFIRIEGNSIYDFEQAITQYVPDIEPGEIYGDAVIQNLVSNGWTIIPPQP